MDQDREELNEGKRFKKYWNVKLQDLVAAFLKASVEKRLWINEGFSCDGVWGSSSLFTNLVGPNRLHTLSPRMANKAAVLWSSLRNILTLLHGS